MTPWTPETAGQSLYAFDSYTPEEQATVLNYITKHFPPPVYEHHRACKERAVANTLRSKKVLSGAEQVFPTVVDLLELPPDAESLKQCAIVLMAGGEGERLRLSLQAGGVSESSLKNFTKATYPLTDFYKDFGTLQANLCIIASLAKKYGAALPVAVTTGPAGSVTARVIPDLLAQHEYFGLKTLFVIEQEERLHLTQDNKIVFIPSNGSFKAVTNPDETGGPIMQLKKPINGGESFLSRAARMGCTKVLVLQATGLYDPQIIPAMAAAIAHRDCVGVGILRSSFPDNDPYGTYVVVKKDDARKVVIVEPEIRNDATRLLKNATGNYLPYNTGLYAFDASLLQTSDLPDYATPPKEIIPGLERTPKVGYAATDLFALAHNAAVLNVPAQSFGVIKNADDLGRVAQLGKNLGINLLCEGF